jgi:hypothetical protein
MGYVLVPQGFAMWIAHYGFHLLASGASTPSRISRRTLAA